MVLQERSLVKNASVRFNIAKSDFVGLLISFANTAGATKLGLKVSEAPFFDTVKISVKDAKFLCNKAVTAGVNLRQLDDLTVTISLDETTSLEDVNQLLFVLNTCAQPDFTAESLISEVSHSLGSQASVPLINSLPSVAARTAQFQTL